MCWMCELLEQATVDYWTKKEETTMRDRDLETEPYPTNPPGDGDKQEPEPKKRPTAEEFAKLRRKNGKNKRQKGKRKLDDAENSD